jgi:hypothetical protein
MFAGSPGFATIQFLRLIQTLDNREGEAHSSRWRKIKYFLYITMAFTLSTFPPGPLARCDI